MNLASAFEYDFLYLALLLEEDEVSGIMISKRALQRRFHVKGLLVGDMG